MRHLLTITLLTLLLTGCTNWLGMTTRTQIRADADVRIAQLQAEAEKAAAVQETVRAGLWAGMVPMALGIVAAGVIVAILVWWQGRIWLERTKQAAHLTTPPALATRGPSLRQLQSLAAQEGYELVIDGNTAYLIDSAGRRVGRRRLAG
jgi:hypothetical protein